MNAQYKIGDGLMYCGESGPCMIGVITIIERNSITIRWDTPSYQFGRVYVTRRGNKSFWDRTARLCS